jgi:DNA polymerase III delta subunit
VKFYEFLDKAPAIPKLVFIEGTERVFADRALELIEERLLGPAERDFNVDRIDATESEALGRIASAISSLPFLAQARVVVAKNVHELRAQPRRDLWEVAQAAPDGNVLVIEDLVSPASKRPEPMSKGAGRSGVLRIDTMPGADARRRFIEESLTALDAKAERAVVATLAGSDADLIAIRTDLEKLALLGKTITLEDLMRETLVTSDAKAYQFASLLIEGKLADAYALADEMLTNDRNAAPSLLYSVATEYLTVWEIARGGELAPRMRWREGKLRPIARRMGERRARLGYERAVRGFEAIVTGRAEDPRTLLALLTAAAER